MSPNQLPKGKHGEDLAVSFLQNKGFHIIDRNFHSPFGELDIVATDGKTLVFVEVKTRSSLLFGAPQESVTQSKLEKLTKTAYFFKKKYPNTPKSMRIDVIAILLTGSQPQIEHLVNVTG